MKFRPLRDNVLIKRVEANEKTSSGLYIPSSAADKPQEANVIAVGPGRKNDDGTLVSMTVKQGDIVLFGEYSGKKVTLDGEEHLIMRESEILAIIER